MAMSTTILERTATFGRMIKFSHSVFALPFAFVSGLVCTRIASTTISLVDIFLLIVCMVSARTAAMGYNRIADRDIDATNPRTQQREIPSGHISLTQAGLFTCGAVLIFVVASFCVNTLCGLLSIPVIGLLLGYSKTKRFTPFSHLVLGLCLGAAPVGVWFALTGQFSWTPLALCGAVTFWTAGFDIYYSCQDAEFDAAHDLHSIPARLGAMNSIRLVRLFHALAIVLYIVFGHLAGLGIVFHVGVALVAGILIYEAWILRNGDLSRIDLAFFNLNGYVSILFAIGATIDDVVIGSI